MKALADEVRKRLGNVNIDELPDLLTIYNLAKIWKEIKNMAENKLEAVVVAIGTDIKNLRKGDWRQGSERRNHRATAQRKRSTREVRHFGRRCPRGIWTRSKKSQEKIATLNGDTSGAIVAKLTEWSEDWRCSWCGLSRSIQRGEKE